MILVLELGMLVVLKPGRLELGMLVLCISSCLELRTHDFAHDLVKFDNTNLVCFNLPEIKEIHVYSKVS
jgi:hypothetical protein